MAFQVHYQTRAARTIVGLVESKRLPVWILRLYIRIQALAEALLDERGQDLIEYVLLASLISLAAMSQR